MLFASDKLHRLIEASDWDAVLSRINKRPAEVRKMAYCEALAKLPEEDDEDEDDEGLSSSTLPLTHALAKHAPLNVVRALVAKYGAAIRKKETAYSRLPLHVVCLCRNHAQVVRFVMRQYPKAVAIQDKLNRVPLHYAVGNGCSIDGIQALLHDHHETLLKRDHNGWTPLHIACGVGAPVQVVRMLMENGPAALWIEAKNGYLPLDMAKNHLTAGTPRREELMEFLQTHMKSPEPTTTTLVQVPTSTSNDETCVM